MVAQTRQGQIGSFSQYTSKPNWGNLGITNLESTSYGNYQGSLIDFGVDFKGNKVTGTFNPSQGGGSSAVTQDSGFVSEAFNLLNDPTAISLGGAQKVVGMNQSDNPFFGEFFNYYLGLAQERQANLAKAVGRKDLLSGESASLVGGSLI